MDDIDDTNQGVYPWRTILKGKVVGYIERRA